MILSRTAVGVKVSSGEAQSDDVEALGQQAVLYHARILERSVTDAVDYWLLGRVLLRARSKFKKGEWYAWLKQHEIGRHRADRARLLAAAFASVRQMEGLTLEESLALAKQSRPPALEKLARKLGRRLDDLARTIERTADESKALAQERNSLLAKAERLTEAIEYFRRTCDASPD
jgi:hypothetical protein